MDTSADDGDRLLVSADMQAIVDELYERGLDGTEILALLAQQQDPDASGAKLTKTGTRSSRSH